MPHPSSITRAHHWLGPYRRLALAVCLSAAACAACDAARAAPAPIVVLDTGHTQAQTGALGATGITERAYNVALADTVAQLLAPRVQLVRTGTGNQGWTLTQRSAAAAGAALFVSIHHDSIQQSWLDQGLAGQYAGFSIFVSGKQPPAVTAAALGCARIIGTRLAGAGERPSHYHATPIAGENRPLLDAATGVHRFDDLVVLKTSAAPAILIEAGVIVNPLEAQRLASAATITRLAVAVAGGILQCLGASA